MACFLVPAGEAVVTAIAAKAMHHDPETVSIEAPQRKGPSFVRRLPWLTNLLLGGAVLLLFEHLWHGEVVPFFPFLTAAMNAADTAAMLQEMATVGVTMAVLVTAFWAVLVLVTDAIEARAAHEQPAEQ